MIFPFSKAHSFLPNGVQGFFPAAKQLGHEADQSTPTSAEDKNEWSYTSTSPLFFHGVERDNSAFGTSGGSHIWGTNLRIGLEDLSTIKKTRKAGDRDLNYSAVRIQDMRANLSGVLEDFLVLDIYYCKMLNQSLLL